MECNARMHTPHKLTGLYCYMTQQLSMFTDITQCQLDNCTKQWQIFNFNWTVDIQSSTVSRDCTKCLDFSHKADIVSTHNIICLQFSDTFGCIRKSIQTVKSIPKQAAADSAATWLRYDFLLFGLTFWYNQRHQITWLLRVATMWNLCSLPYSNIRTDKTA